jgi:hypothetical protein
MSDGGHGVCMTAPCVRIIRRTATFAGVLSALIFGVAGGAWASVPGPYFTALPASGSTELQTARGGAIAATLPDSEVLIAGGNNGSNDTGFLQSAELFNPVSDTFTALPASGNTELQTARSGAVAAPLPDGEVLIAGGNNAEPGSCAALSCSTPPTTRSRCCPRRATPSCRSPGVVRWRRRCPMARC